ncbi:hypothetical protein DRN74_05165 [Candidatus Micrarchaeota archaeon]|nr:MAG: hypothetical protein DRN74_05165 [Candidatus Micrarchaeota archaeon]
MITLFRHVKSFGPCRTHLASQVNLLITINLTTATSAALQNPRTLSKIIEPDIIGWEVKDMKSDKYKGSNLQHMREYEKEFEEMKKNR